MMDKRPVIVEIGQDTVCLGMAAILASSRFEIRGFTFFEGRENPVYRELEALFGLSSLAPCVFGDGKPIRASSPDGESSGAHRFIREQALLSDGRLEIIAFGPLTNPAKAVLACPETIRGIRRIVFTGGAHGTGDITPAAERNVHADAPAAKGVFDCGIPVLMVGLDVAEPARLSDAEARNLLSRGPFGYEGLIEPSRKSADGSLAALDLAAACAASDEGFLHLLECRVDIEIKGEVTYGKSVCDLDGVSRRKPNARVSLGMDRVCYLERVGETVSQIPRS
jgi:inosine-uridine nucleoside N-ribohydrolase